MRLVSNLRVSTFDKYNPFTIKGSAPAYLADLMFDSLLTGSLDETASGYGLLANDVEVAADGLSATFRLAPQARFHNGEPVLAVDVKHSFDTLMPCAMHWIRERRRNDPHACRFAYGAAPRGGCSA